MNSITDIIEIMQEAISSAEKNGESQTSASWSMQEGVLLSCNDAKKILNELKLHRNIILHKPRALGPSSTINDESLKSIKENAEKYLGEEIVSIHVHNDFHQNEMERLYDWIESDNREPAQTFFSAGIARNIATKIEMLNKNR